MHFVADLHIHSHSSMATSKQMNLENIYKQAQLKGITVVGSGDFTHPGQLGELKEKVEPAELGLYRLKDKIAEEIIPEIPESCRSLVRFILTAEHKKYKQLCREIEKGLSSDPAMNWRLTQLDGISLISNSDAHSPAKLMRNANLFDTELSYQCIIDAICHRDSKKFFGTLEFFPQEGKYHYDGHRSCQVCMSPKETIKQGGRCPKCGGKVIIGVMHRVKELADREEGDTYQDSMEISYNLHL